MGLDWRRAGSAERRPAKTETETGEAGRRADAVGRLEFGWEPRDTRHAGGRCASGECSVREPGPREFSHHRRDEGSQRGAYGNGSAGGFTCACGFPPGVCSGADCGCDTKYGADPVSRCSIPRDHHGH